MMVFVLRKELTAFARDGRFLLLAAAMALLVSGVLWSSMQRWRGLADDRAQMMRQTRAQWEHQGDKHPHRGAHFGLYATRADTALAAFDPGLTHAVGQAIWLEPHRRGVTRFSADADAPPSVRLARLTPAFAAFTLLPLFLIASGFALVSGERESGTLRMMHGSGLSMRTLLIGKWLALWLIALLLFLPLLLAPLLVRPISADEAGQLLTLAAFGSSYLACICACVIAVSACAGSNRAALMALLALWTVFILLLPRLGTAVSASVVRLPTAGAFWAGIHHDHQQGLPGDPPLAEQVKRNDAKLLAQYNVTRVEDLPVGINALRRMLRDDYANRVHGVHFTRLWNAYQQQERILDGFALLTPKLAIDALSMTFSGTGLAQQRQFEDAAEHYRQAFTRRIDEWDARVSRGVGSYDARYAGNALWKQQSAFAHPAPSLRLAWDSAWLMGLVMIGWLCAAVWWMLHAAGCLTP